MDRKRAKVFASILQKANKVLYVVLFAFVCFSVRIWYLSVVTHAQKSAEAARSRQKTIVEPALRGTIRDRFNVVLAANEIDYRVGVLWPPIQEIPRSVKRGKERISVRGRYVTALSTMLGRELGIDAKRVEESIYAYAVFSGRTPLIIKSDLSEKEYYRLNMLTLQWPGLMVERAVKRVYPQGRSGSHVIGYTAAVNREEYDSALSERRFLQEYVSRVEGGEEIDPPEGYSSFFAAKRRLMLLEKRAYTLNDEIGKMGVEKAFEQQLRGLSGKKRFFTNAQGEFLKEGFGSSDPIPGKRLVLTLSSELQLFCERLLCESEEDRASYCALNQGEQAKNPLVRGGAIIALEPKTAEVVACASFPRFDPNDFVRSRMPEVAPKRARKELHRWLETDEYLRQIWDMRTPVCLEYVDEKGEFHDKQIPMTWLHFIETVVPQRSQLFELFAREPSMAELIELQREVKGLSERLQTGIKEVVERFDTSPELFGVSRAWFERLSSTRERLLLLDLSRLLVREEEVCGTKARLFKKMSIDTFRSLVSAKESFLEQLREGVRQAFIKGPFESWKQEHKKAFLAEKRKQEQRAKIPARPFLQYLDKELDRQFSLWWDENKESLCLSALLGEREEIASWSREAVFSCVQQAHEALFLLSSLLQRLEPEKRVSLLQSIKGYAQLDHRLWGYYTAPVRGRKPVDGKSLIQTYLSMSCSPVRAHSHMHASAPGSIFKLVVAYAALRQQIERFHGAPTPDFYTITDTFFHKGNRSYVAIDSTGKPIPRVYKGGRMPKSAHGSGNIDLIKAIGRSSNAYFALLAGDVLESPQQLLDAARAFGYGAKTGMSLPGEVAGHLPDDLETNRTGLYTSAIGQHTLLATPMQSAMMFTALANGGELLVPRFVRMAVGPECLLQRARSYKKLMRHIGLEAPIWLVGTARIQKKQIVLPQKKVRRTLSLSEKEKQVLFEGMRESAAYSMSPRMRQLFAHRPYLFSAHTQMVSQMIGKSSTAEVLERLGVGIGQSAFMYNHTWYGAIFFPTGEGPIYKQEPELVVLVFLRYGRLGRDASLLAAAVARQWREIVKRHERIYE